LFQDQGLADGHLHPAQPTLALGTAPFQQIGIEVFPRRVLRWWDQPVAPGIADQPLGVTVSRMGKFVVT
jgi:hypothetical protein